MKWLWAGALTLLGVVSAQAFTCADVRALSADQRAYYIKVLNITPAQQESIRQACYGSKARRTTASAEAPGRHVETGERNTRAEQ